MDEYTWINFVIDWLRCQQDFLNRWQCLYELESFSMGNDRRVKEGQITSGDSWDNVSELFDGRRK